jgi:class 3 adenylate cyclase
MPAPPTRPLALPVAASFGVHAAALPLAAMLGQAACPLLDATGFGPTSGAMTAVLLVAWAGYWAAQLRWARLWRRAAAGEGLPPDDVASLFGGTARGVVVHAAAFLAGTWCGALVLHAAYGHDVGNLRFWYSAMLTAGFVATLNAVLLDLLLARSLARAGTSAWRYRAPPRRFELRHVVVFALATLPAAILTALIYRRVVLDGRPVSGAELVAWLARVGGLTLAWSLAVGAALRAVERRAAGEALALIRELGRPEIPLRAPVVTGGPWGETASSLNLAADALEQRARLERAVRTYVGDELAEATRGGDVTEVRGERCRMTVLFCDIRGFTQRSATRAPEEIVALLDRWFALAVDAVEAHGGRLDKFLGDGLMAWFDERTGAADLGAPRAVAASQDLLVRLAAFNADLEARGEEPFRIGIGLHAGEVVRGNLGAGRRKQWTVIGDTVNLASRVEGLTKGLGRDLVFTDAVARHLASERVVALGPQDVRGQPHPVACFSTA